MFEWVVAYLILGALFGVFYFCTVGRSDAAEFLSSIVAMLSKGAEPAMLTLCWLIGWPVGVFLVFHYGWTMGKE